jgi:hypothetical protein
LALQGWTEGLDKWEILVPQAVKAPLDHLDFEVKKE